MNWLPILFMLSRSRSRSGQVDRMTDMVNELLPLITRARFRWSYEAYALTAVTSTGCMAPRISSRLASRPTEDQNPWRLPCGMQMVSDEIRVFCDLLHSSVRRVKRLLTWMCPSCWELRATPSQPMHQIEQASQTVSCGFRTEIFNFIIKFAS